MFRPNSSAITQANENYAHMSECNQKKNSNNFLRKYYYLFNWHGQEDNLESQSFQPEIVVRN